MKNNDLTLTAYESTYECLSGFRVFKSNELMGTIEKRSDKWIGAIFVNNKILTFENENFENVVNKMHLLIS